MLAAALVVGAATGTGTAIVPITFSTGMQTLLPVWRSLRRESNTQLLAGVPDLLTSPYHGAAASESGQQVTRNGRPSRRHTTRQGGRVTLDGCVWHRPGRRRAPAGP